MTTKRCGARAFRFWLNSAALLLCGSVAAQAAEIRVSTGTGPDNTDRGAANSQLFVSQGAPWKVQSNSWQLRWFPGSQELTRSYTLFQLPPLPLGETITAATVTFTHPGNSYNSPDPTETVGLWSIDSTPFTELRDNRWTDANPGADRSSIFIDLGTGTQFASFDSNAQNAGGTQTVTLNAQAIAALNAIAGAGGGQWGFGAAITSGGSTVGPERVFQGTGGANNATATVLTLTTAAATPNTPVFVDTGYFAHRFTRGSGATVQTQRFGSPDLHQGYLSGNNQFGNDDVVRRSYFAFDLSGVNEPIASATLRLWAPAPSPINANSGAYGSDNSSERFELRSLDDFTPAQVLAAPFGLLTTGHELNVGIWTDLENGTTYGGRELTIADEQNPGLIPLPNAVPVPDCSVVGTDGCGRFIDIPLNAAGVASLNAATGTWLAGGVVSSIDGNVANEALWAGASVDFANPQLRTPAPQLIITTGPANQQPVANAGADQTGAIGTAVQLDGSASNDPDGNTPLTYLWTLSAPAGSNAALSGATSASASFTPDVAGAYSASLVVTDALGLASAADSVAITVAAPANQQPVANAGADQTGAIGTAVTLDGSASNDPDGNTPLTYLWTLSAPAGSNAALSGATSASASFTPDVAGAYSASLLVTDALGLASAADSVTVTVSGTGNPPPLANAGVDQNVAVGALVTLDGSASSDDEGGALTYEWTLSAPAGSNAVLATPTAVTASFTADVAGAYTATLVVTDAAGVASAPDSVTITAGTGNRAPVAEAGADRSAAIGEVVQLDGGASSDLDGDALTYRWTLTVPEGSTAVLSDAAIVNPSFSVDRAGVYTAALIVTDTAGLQSEPDTVTIATEGDNLPPVADAGEDRSAQPGELVQLDGTGSSDPNADDELSYEWALSAPEGSAAVLSDATSATPTFTVDRAGEYAAALIVRDEQGLQSEPDTVVISTANVAPVADAGADQSATAGDTVQLDGSGSRDENGDELVYRWSLLSAPAGSQAVLSAEDGVQVSLNTDLPGTYVAQLLVNDGVLDSQPDAVSIQVAASDSACQIRYRGVARGNEGQRITFSGLGQSEGGEVSARNYFVEVRRGQRPLQLRSISTQTLVCTGEQVTLTGEASVSGERNPVPYTIELWRKSRSDFRYRLRLGTGYDSGKLKLSAGSIDIESDTRY